MNLPQVLCVNSLAFRHQVSSLMDVDSVSSLPDFAVDDAMTSYVLSTSTPTTTTVLTTRRHQREAIAREKPIVKAVKIVKVRKP